MDSDLAEAVAKLKDIFTRRSIPTRFGKAEPAVLDELRNALRIPSRYRAFLQAADPVDVETVSSVERVRFIPSDILDISKLDAQSDCPVFSVTMGAHPYRPELYASSFEQFLRILATNMELAA